MYLASGSDLRAAYMRVHAYTYTLVGGVTTGGKAREPDMLDIVLHKTELGNWDLLLG